MKKYNEMLFPVNGKGEVVEKKEDMEEFPSPIEDNKNEKLMTTTEIANILHTSNKVILENAKKLFPDKKFENGKATYFNEKEASEIIKNIDYDNSQAKQPLLAGKGQVKTEILLKEEFNSTIEGIKDLSRDNKLKLGLTALQSLLEDLQNENKDLKVEKEENRPLVEYATSVNEVDDTISFNEFAKAHFDTLCIGEKKLFSLCREIGILQSTQTHWNIPYQEYIDRGYFKLIQQVYNKGIRSNTNMKTVITGKGRVWLLNKLKNK